MMANKPSVNKRITAIQLPLELVVRVRKAAKFHKMSVNQFIVMVLHNELDNIPLTDEDLDWIRREVRRNEAKRS